MPAGFIEDRYGIYHGNVGAIKCPLINYQLELNEINLIKFLFHIYTNPFVLSVTFVKNPCYINLDRLRNPTHIMANIN